MNSDRDIAKLLIETSPNVEEADKVITQIFEFDTIAEKIAFLKGTFDVEIISKHDSPGISKEKSAEMDYFTMLSVIINN